MAAMLHTPVFEDVDMYKDTSNKTVMHRSVQVSQPMKGQVLQEMDAKRNMTKTSILKET
jgi:hypothetical protein